MNPFGIAVGDFNGDGIADLAVTNFDGQTVSVLLGEATEPFSRSRPIRLATSPLGVAVGDFNGRLLDLA